MCDAPILSAPPGQEPDGGVSDGADHVTCQLLWPHVSHARACSCAEYVQSKQVGFGSWPEAICATLEDLLAVFADAQNSRFLAEALPFLVL
jgi:hypothetical protein